MDIVFLIEKYLADKFDLRDPENDSLCIENNQILRWNFTNIPAPSMEELLALQPEVEAKAAQEAINKASLEYLAATDWYAIRQLENGTLVPQDILQARQEARSRIVK